MPSRYTRVFTLPPNQFYPGSPVLVEAGALLKDNVSGAVVAQLKLKNIGASEILAVKVRLRGFDVTGDPVGSVISHQYLDLNAGRDAEFGQKEPITVPDATTRSFELVGLEVVPSGAPLWSSEESATRLPSEVDLEAQLPEPELLKQFKLDFCASATYVPQRHKDLWRCACGAINRDHEQACHRCGAKISRMDPLDVASLRGRADARLAEERREAQKRLEAERAAKRSMRLAAVLATVAVAVVAVSLVTIPPMLEERRREQELAAQQAEQEAALAAELAAEQARREPARKLLADVLGMSPEDLSVGDAVQLGSYEQDVDASNGPEPVEWHVVSNDGTTLLLLCDHGLGTLAGADKVKYWRDWADGIEAWLGDFSLASGLADLGLEAEYLSATSIESLVPEANRTCTPTAYAAQEGVWADDEGRCSWWVRGTEEQDRLQDRFNAPCVDNTGSLTSTECSNPGVAIRPAIFI